MPIGAKLQESRILFDSIAGLKEVLGQVAVDYGKSPIPVAVVPSTWIQREIAEILGGEVRYPFIGISLQRFARNAESYNDNLRRIGVAIAKQDSNRVNVYKLVPVIANFRVRYLTQDFADLMAFASRWLLRQKDIQFTLGNEEFRLRVKVKLNEDLSIPEEENNDWGTTFQLETDLDMQTYIGELEVRTKITKLKLTPFLWDSTNQVATQAAVPRTINVEDTEATITDTSEFSTLSSKV